MKATKRISALLLCILMLCSVVMLSACSEEKPADSNEAVYKVTVVDGLGTPYTEKVIVKFLQNGQSVAMAPVDANGVVEKTLTKGDYTVQIDSTGDSECYYDTAAAKLTADQTELTVTMAYMVGESTGSVTATSPVTGESMAYDVYNAGVGSVYLPLDAQERTYVLFTPTEGGTYEISAVGGAATIGYYGAPHFVQSNNVGEVKDNVLTLSVSASMIGSGSTGTSVYVIGIDAGEGTEGIILNIKRAGDPAWNIADEPYSVYQPKQEIKDFTLPEGTELTAFDITASTDTYVLVLNEEDHCYHLGTADGPAVYANLQEAVYGISLLTMVGENIYDADGVQIESGTSPFRYVYNNGKDDFFKEDYTAVTREFITARDKTTGVYPLTEDLYYILKMGIDHMGWAEQGTMNYLFSGEPNANEEITWMFLLCHAQGSTTNPGDSTDPGNTTDPGTSTNPGGSTTTNPGGSTTTKPDPIVDNKDEPIIPVPADTGLGDNSTHFEATIQPNHETYFNLYKMVSTVILTIDNKDAYVIYNKKTYEAVNGVVTVPGIKSQYTNSPVELIIGNKGTAETTFDVKLSHPVGSQGNPYKMKLSSFTVNAEKNNEQGVYYSWTATKSGTLTLTLDKVTSKSGNVQAGITVTVTGSDLIPHQVVLGEGETSVTIEVEAGDSVVVIIGALPNEKNQYLAATIDVTASLK